MKKTIGVHVAQIWDWWNRIGASSAKVAHRCHPQASWRFPHKLLAKPRRRLQAVVSRLCIGNATNNRILSFVRGTPSACDHCPTADSTHHRLFDCPATQPQRSTLRAALKIPPATALTYKNTLCLQSIPPADRAKHFQAILTFLTSTNLHNLFVASNTPDPSNLP